MTKQTLTLITQTMNHHQPVVTVMRFLNNRNSQWRTHKEEIMIRGAREDNVKVRTNTHIMKKIQTRKAKSNIYKYYV